MNITILFILFLGLFDSSATEANSRSFLPKSFTANFTQVYKSALKGTTKESKGTIEYKYPGRIRFETLTPDNVIFVSNPEKTWYYSAPFMKGNPGELTIKATTKNVLSKFFDILKQGLKSNKLYSVKVKKRGFLLLFSKKTANEIGIREAFLHIKSTSRPQFQHISSVEIVYLDKKRVKMILSSIKQNIEFKKDNFVFQIPKNTRITK